LPAALDGHETRIPRFALWKGHAVHFMRIRAAGSETPMLVDNSTYYRLDSLTEDLSGAFFAAVDGADPGRSGSWWRHGGSTRHALVGPYDDVATPPGLMKVD
jgi:hypothetical protein